ncbi:MAG: YdcF family protein [Cyclobacteriaceae bacterium]
MNIIFKVFKGLVLVVSILGALILCLNFWIVFSTNDRIYQQIENVPSKKVSLILGTSKRTIHGEANKYFQERITAAADLYHRGVTRHIIVSGDNETIYYNEPQDMYNALVELGVDKADITLDYAGFRTLDSVVRSKMVFGQSEMIIITQDFHCYRALFIADYNGIDAVAYSADNKDPLPTNLAIREILARAYAVMDLYILKKTPKYLGEKEEIILP